MRATLCLASVLVALGPSSRTAPPLCLAGKRRGRKAAAGGGFGAKAAGGGGGGFGAPRKRAPRQRSDVPSPPPPPPPAAADIASIVDGLDEDADPFFQLAPHILLTEFRSAEIERVLQTIEFAQGRRGVDADVIADPWRPHGELHAYMPGIDASPWHDPSRFDFAAELEANHEAIKAEFYALLRHECEFQHVTEMNYDSGWKTMVLYYNGKPIKDFPSHLCPVTSAILRKVPIAGVRRARTHAHTRARTWPAHSNASRAPLGSASPDSIGSCRALAFRRIPTATTCGSRSRWASRQPPIAPTRAPSLRHR